MDFVCSTSQLSNQGLPCPQEELMPHLFVGARRLVWNQRRAKPVSRSAWFGFAPSFCWVRLLFSLLCSLCWVFCVSWATADGPQWPWRYCQWGCRAPVRVISLIIISLIRFQGLDLKKKSPTNDQRLCALSSDSHGKLRFRQGLDRKSGNHILSYLITANFLTKNL